MCSWIAPPPLHSNLIDLKRFRGPQIHARRLGTAGVKAEASSHSQKILADFFGLLQKPREMRHGCLPSLAAENFSSTVWTLAAMVMGHVP